MNANEFHERERFEHDLINRRLTWLFTSQSVLFAAYGVATRAQKSDNPHAFLKMTAISGSVISSLILLGVIAAFIAKRTVWKEYQKTVPSAQFGVKTWITYLGFVPDFFLPVIFSAAWIYILRNTS